MKKEEDVKRASIRNMKFAPKKPPPKKKLVVPKIESSNIKKEPIDEELLLHIKTAKSNAGLGRRMPKTETNANAEKISFGATTFGGSGPCTGSSSAKAHKVKVYKEPWDHNSNYPVTLPLRRQDEGDPQILDEEEFGGTTASLFATGTELDPASKLGLRVESENSQKIFFQFPAVLPKYKPDVGAGSSRGAKNGCKLSECPRGGYIGKFLVYKSGKVKMELGKTLFDVYPGSECKFGQDVALFDGKAKRCGVIGQLNEEHAIITPDINSMLDSLGLGTEIFNFM